MIVSPNPASPPPVIAPRSDLVNPNWAPRSPRIPPLMEKPIPAATSVMKLAKKIERWLMPPIPPKVGASYAAALVIKVSSANRNVNSPDQANSARHDAGSPRRIQIFEPFPHVAEQLSDR